MNPFRILDSLSASVSRCLLKVYGFTGKDAMKKANMALVVVCSFLLIFILNRNHPLFGDDWMYSMLPEPSNDRVKSFTDILYTQYEHYFTWGGRSVVHVIAQSLLLLGKLPADILNSLAYVALTLVIYTFANRGNKKNPSLLIGINLLIFFFQPALGSTMLWKTGSANYLWGTLIVLSFLLPYRNYLFNSQKTNGNIVKSIAFLFFGIVAGWTNENMGVALIAMTALFICYYKSSSMKIPAWAWTGLIGAIVGCAFMVAAPGNYARMDMIGGTSEHVFFVSVYINQLLGTMAAFYYYSIVLVFILVLTLFFWLSCSKKENRNRQKGLMLIIFSGALVAVLAMSASPIFPGRASYGINSLIILAIAILFANLDFDKLLVKRITSTVLFFGLLFLSVDYYRGYKELSSVSQVYAEREAQLSEEKNLGVSDITFLKRIEEPKTRFLHHFDLSYDSLDWHNRIYSRYNELHSVKVAP
ncbi:DUF6056 family protein [Dysgonomonas sp. 520]|uniref:DUF3329 domain-containing protein n=1 Tax=Dysgonomonas sp. 520 TaxID=2302931 RepID=UPI0013D78687|nr:DUF6056 family protein [Dysgonomonas sp. 520]NDW08107.1 hypothetical protein [Dysgonomonas sp. 520]